ncbi:GTPase HflX [Haloplasma contractile]|uniref:GTPase HflX n=1 Tax=Haloplasma contractile SSD-17B TaxID=1033810 RepID=U2FQ25_9MOLU|nr:GTPase HflX [Haloplasma contractile]ERJ13149.1 GTPase HflX protein [Haloplasma contractile SSD-17B]
MNNYDQNSRVVIVGVNTNQDDFDYQMEELKNLAVANDYHVVETMTQNLYKINNKYYMGKGKLEELANLVSHIQVPIVIFNDELSPSQVRIISEYLSCKIMDRTKLILDIFNSRAKTKEAKIQTEIALLEYRLPRLVGEGDALDRQRGGGVHNKGAGETKLETDRRKISQRIKSLNIELSDIKTKRETTRKRRQKSDLPIISLIGYTNAGKSTIMNALLELYHHNDNKEVFEKNMLFATLNTSIRNIKLHDNKEFLLTDTVGFIKKLPHQVVNAFRSTLEEVLHSDLILHVVDCSDPNHKEHMETTQNVLNELGYTDVPIIMVYNKVDLLEANNSSNSSNGVYISAKYKRGFDHLVELIEEHALKTYIRCEMLIPFQDGELVHYFNEHANVLTTSYDYNGTMLYLECKQSDYEKYRDYVVEA